MDKKEHYKRHAKWQKQKYTRIVADIDKQLGIDLKDKVKQNNISIAGWITQHAKEYLKEE